MKRCFGWLCGSHAPGDRPQFRQSLLGVFATAASWSTFGIATEASQPPSLPYFDEEIEIQIDREVENPDDRENERDSEGVLPSILPSFPPESPVEFPEPRRSQPVPDRPPESFPETTSPPKTPTYTLGGGDRLQITIFGVPDYSGEYAVTLENTLNLPVIGSVNVGGLTLSQTRDVISQRYARILRRPIVTLDLTAPRPLRIAVSGEVSSPGAYTIAPSGDSGFPTLTQALQTAGGITQAADLSRVQLRRSTPEPQTMVLDLWELIENGDLDRDPVLLDGDRVIVPTLTTFEPGLSRRLEATNLAPDTAEPLQIAIVGEVFRPGPHVVAGDGTPPTLTRAIETAGGITALADIRNITLYRRTQAGTQTIELDLWEMLQSGDLDRDPILQSGDSILVPTAIEIPPDEALAIASASFSPDAIDVNVVGEAARPGTIQVPPNTPLNEALLAAGGFDTARARRRITLIRLNPNGTVSRRRISVDFEDRVNEETNPILQNDDIILVGRNTFTAVSDTLSNIVRPIGNLFIFDRFFRLFNFGDEN
ncbi:SLBB domain-containing protein [Baaleninema simplex]|uniref:SLBB domain-containing protein n=1 Tax=Baaleninema simplex TaxID=2862350 RepID=UPI000349C08F|nr:SLBB domain-containing protein [Baaleninema simplex]